MQAISQVTEYSTRMCALRSAVSTITISTTLRTLVHQRSLSIFSTSLGRLFLRFLPHRAALVLQYINEYAEQDVRDVVERFEGRDGRPTGAPGVHADGDL